MPTYEYRCPKGHDFERFYKTISGSVAEVPCPECGEIAGRQLSAGAGLMFKGSGFYLTDYGKNAHRGEGAKPDSGKAESPKPTAESSNAGSPGPKGESPKAESSKAESAKPGKSAPKPSKPKSE